jgi:hypothetical protein
MTKSKQSQPTTMAVGIDYKVSPLANSKSISELVSKFEGVISCGATFPGDKSQALSIWWSVGLTPMPIVNAQEIVTVMEMIDGITFARETTEKVDQQPPVEEEVSSCMLPPSTSSSNTRLYTRLC